MKKIIQYYALTFVLVAFAGCTDEKEMKYAIDPALSPTSVTTGAISNLTYSSAEVTGAASMNENIVDRGIFIANNQQFTEGIALSATTVDSATGNYTTSITDLQEQTLYYIKAYATSFAGSTTFGEVKNFTTPEAPPQWEDLVGTWTVTEDFNSGNGWNNVTYGITISGVAGDKFKIKIDGFAPYMYNSGHTIYATVNNMQLTLPSQELLPGWDEPDYRTYFSALKNGTLVDNVGLAFPVTNITANDQGKLEITLLGGLNTYSYQIYDMSAADGAWVGVWGYCRNTKWVKQ
ncbi:MAG: hypothetical protein LBD91_07340 [Prevotellaceae bacterium]|jgi:hypothetical protein|nr:hypothetical protein [Prevotellaceae bacterium]